MIKYASLFSGIGGFELGIQEASNSTGIKTKCVFASEFDPESKAKDINKQPARIIYNKNFGEYPHGNIEKTNATDVPDCDLIVGGPPCQDFSIAGKRAGLCGTKGSMFHEFIRIVREKQPRYLLIENVKGILSSNAGWDFARILIELEDAGYWVEWEVRNTKAYIPQNRERVFIVGHLAGSERSGSKIFPIGESTCRIDERAEQTAVNTLTAGGHSGGRHSSMTLICDSAHGFGKKIADDQNTVPTLRSNNGACSNNVIIHGNNKDRISEDIVPTLCNHAGTGGNNVPLVHSTWPRSSKTRKGGTGHLQRNDGCTYCTDPNNHMAVEMHGLIRRLTPIECELLQGFPKDWTAGVADSNRYRCIGNSVTVPVVADIMQKILKEMV